MNNEFMKRAIQIAQNGMDENQGGPFGCVVVKNGAIIAEGNNRVTSSNDPTAHAEVVAIRKACEALGTFQLEGCDIYTSCEPCPMCLGAIYWSRPDRIFYAATRYDAADAGFDDSYIYEELKVPDRERKIPTENISRDQAVKLFEAWKRKEDKTDY
ncbi:nucleoside deaminase [Rhodohalobacter sp. SW132]|uniref:nucleoside deaminase n=2 Tax=Rhodohalobacter sp. SW132 TaxID=2293433 RepID=UPI000E23E294|nr:nucleoside deaminase [Rhodohalobacter sp. SW132]